MTQRIDPSPHPKPHKNRKCKRNAYRRRMVGDTAMVSTLVTVVGQPNTPTLAGKGGFRRGLPYWEWWWWLGRGRYETTVRRVGV